MINSSIIAYFLYDKRECWGLILSLASPVEVVFVDETEDFHSYFINDFKSTYQYNLKKKLIKMDFKHNNIRNNNRS